MNGSGCKTCPVKPCETMNYRGSTCAAQREKYGLGDPMTNADRIRSMTDKELAGLLASDDVICPPNHLDCCEKCTECFLKWLQQPAERG